MIRILLSIALGITLGYVSINVMNSIKQYDKDIQDTISRPSMVIGEQ